MKKISIIFALAVALQGCYVEPVCAQDRTLQAQYDALQSQIEASRDPYTLGQLIAAQEPIRAELEAQAEAGFRADTIALDSAAQPFLDFHRSLASYGLCLEAWHEKPWVARVFRKSHCRMR